MTKDLNAEHISDPAIFFEYLLNSRLDVFILESQESANRLRALSRKFKYEFSVVNHIVAYFNR